MLCENYWYPVYAYIRKSGRGVDEAEDLTQDFFHKMVHGELFKKADAERGKLRTFLLTTVSRMLVSEWRSKNRQKRGGGQAPLSLDIAAAEMNYAAEPKDTLTPEKLYDRRWALLTINSVFEQLRSEFTARGKTRHFELLGECLTPGGSDLPYSEIAAELGLSDAAVRQAVRRLRGRFGELMRERVAFTVEGDAEVEEELRSLMEAFH
ncbi:MAG: sigma-70 family RNA polymerase sigma factor [Verrucomicrobiota bacterium]